MTTVSAYSSPWVTSYESLCSHAFLFAALSNVSGFLEQFSENLSIVMPNYDRVCGDFCCPGNPLITGLLFFSTLLSLVI